MYAPNGVSHNNLFFDEIFYCEGTSVIYCKPDGLYCDHKPTIWRYEIDRHTGCIMDSKRESKRDIINLPDIPGQIDSQLVNFVVTSDDKVGIAIRATFSPSIEIYDIGYNQPIKKEKSKLLKIRISTTIGGGKLSKESKLEEQMEFGWKLRKIVDIGASSARFERLILSPSENILYMIQYNNYSNVFAFSLKKHLILKSYGIIDQPIQFILALNNK